MKQNEQKISDTAEQTETNETSITAKPERKYKDRIFRMIFEDKEKLLELYNAVNGTHYENPEDMTITTLENAIYLGMKNDISFILHDQLSLYEHQSTDNPNMPLRNLFYISDVYSGYTKDSNLYGSSIVPLPEPQFLVFYNGQEEMPERWEQKLSDAYQSGIENPSLELRTTVLNINLGKNKELAEKCTALLDYMKYVEKVRKYRQIYTLAEAVELAVDECIREGILAEFLRKNRAEAIKVSIYEYDEERYIRMIKEDEKKKGMQQGIEIGLEQGIQQGIQQGIELGAQYTKKELLKTKLQKGKTLEQIADEMEENVKVIRKLISELQQENEKIE